MAINPRTFEAGALFEPLAVTKSNAMRMVAMPKLVQRFLYHGWVEVVRAGGRGRETVIDFQSLKSAYNRYKRGEHPPPLPSEIAQKQSATTNRLKDIESTTPEKSQPD